MPCDVMKLYNFPQRVLPPLKLVLIVTSHYLIHSINYYYVLVNAKDSDPLRLCLYIKCPGYLCTSSG